MRVEGYGRLADGRVIGQDVGVLVWLVSVSVTVTVTAACLMNVSTLSRRSLMALSMPRRCVSDVAYWVYVIVMVLARWNVASVVPVVELTTPDVMSPLDALLKLRSELSSMRTWHVMSYCRSVSL